MGEGGLPPPEGREAAELPAIGGRGLGPRRGPAADPSPFGTELPQRPARPGQLALEPEVHVGQGALVDVAFGFELAGWPDDRQLPHAVRPVPPLDDEPLTVPLEDPLVMHATELSAETRVDRRRPARERPRARTRRGSDSASDRPLEASRASEM